MWWRSGITLGHTGFLPWQRFFLGEGERAAHTYIVGTTTKGKSKFMVSCLYQDVLAGRGAGVIDPHGDLADDLLRLLLRRPFWRRFDWTRLVYLDPARRDYAVGLNPLALEPGGDPYEVATAVIEVFRRLWPLTLEEAPVFFDLLLHTLLLLIAGELTLLEAPRLLTDRAYREALLARVGKPALTAFFHDRYERWGRERLLRSESTLNKLSALLASDSLRWLLGQQEGGLNLRAVLDRGLVLVVNLGDCGETTARFFGSLLVARLAQAAASRRDIPERARRTPYYLYVDEFQQFVAGEGGRQTFAELLTGAAKFGLRLVLAHQTQGQLEPRLRSVLGNVGVKVVFGVEREDAEVMARRLFAVDPQAVKQAAAFPGQHPLFAPLAEQWEERVAALQALPARSCYVKTPQQAAQRVRTLTVPEGPELAVALAEVKRASLRRYGRAVAEIEAEIAARLAAGVVRVQRQERVG